MILGDGIDWRTNGVSPVSATVDSANESSLQPLFKVATISYPELWALKTLNKTLYLTSSVDEFRTPTSRKTIVLIQERALSF